MKPETDDKRLDAFLSVHGPVDIPSAFASGELFGDWRVTAYLGRGGSGEVYRVVHAALGTAAALKVCVRNPERDAARDAAVCARFRREAKLLADNVHPAFPRFLGFGEREGRPWYVMELLEQRPLPTAEKDIVRFLLALASGIQQLHSLGLIHRDIKPANILWRGENPILVDLGLAKDVSAVRGHAGQSFSIVDGRAVGVGTPRSAAPEQLTGDEVSFATDVYALGMLANDCFSGRPPRAWRRIIQRATAAVPVQRYATADAFARAIWRLRVRTWIVGALVGLLAASVLALWVLRQNEAMPTLAVAPLDRAAQLASEQTAAVQPAMESEAMQLSWHDLCCNFTTNIVTWHTTMQHRPLAPGEHPMMMGANAFETVSWAETNALNVVEVRLDGQTVTFDEPIDLDAEREYLIVGPGVLDAQFSSASTATVRVVNCIFRNRTKTSPADAGIDYVLDGGAYLNFTDLPATEGMKLEAGARIRSNGMSEGRRWWRIKGPDDLLDLLDEDNQSSIYSATM